MSQASAWSRNVEESVATPVPAVERAGRILSLLASQPGRDLTVSQVAAELGLSKATCFATLVCMTSMGWVVRDEARKMYGLGPELVRLGWASIEQVPGIAVARREMFALARDLNVGCFVCRLVGDDMVILDRAGLEVGAFDLPALDALRVPASPPLGSVYYAWSSPSEIQAWLHRAGHVGSKQELEANRLALSAIRERGYSIGGGIEVQLQLEHLLERLGTSHRDERLRLALTLADLVRGTPAIGEPGSHHPISHLLAPAFGADRGVALTLTIVGRPGQVHDGNVERYAKPLLAAMDRITASIGGRHPDRARTAASV
jgi:DNA-binding IclR family transcriptional regulator